MSDEQTPGTPGPTGPGETPDPTAGYRFDPMTGEPINRDPGEQQFTFNPMTGERLSQHGDTPAAVEEGPQRGSRRSRKRMIAGGVVALALVGGAVAAAVTLSGPSELEQQQDACRAVLGDYLDALDTVDSRLNVGLNIRDYTEVVGEASVAKDDVDKEAKILEDAEFCGSAQEAADVAVMMYSLTASIWNDCIFEDTDCDPDDLDLSKGWSTNAADVAAAKKAIEDAEPVDPDSETGERIERLGEIGEILEGTA